VVVMVAAAKYNGSCVDHGGLGVARSHAQLYCEVCQLVIDTQILPSFLSHNTKKFSLYLSHVNQTMADSSKPEFKILYAYLDYPCKIVNC
jgi:hypothetical protein